MSASLGAGLVWFLVILIAIPVALWLIKRTPFGAAMSGMRAGMAPMRAVSTLSLGAHQRIVTVEVGQGEERRWLVLGVTPQSINTLHELSPQAEAAAPVAEMPALVASFGSLLNKARDARR